MSNYLYNGWILPKLPEWDKTVYLYAYIHKDHRGEGGRYVLLIFDIELYWDGEYCLWRAATGNTINQARVMCFYDEEGVRDNDWLEFTYYNDYKINSYDAWPDMLWFNTDILNEDGSVHLAASDPVPITPDIDLASWLAGYRLGCIARETLRKKE